MNERQRDTELAQVLGTAEVPDHRAGFWDELDARLRAEPTYVTAMGARRRGWGRRAVALAVAAAVLALVVVVTRPDREHTPVTTVSSTTTTAPTVEQPAVDAVDRFVRALGNGDLPQAASLLGPRSEEYAIAVAGSVDALLRPAEEGYGAWAAVADRRYRTVTVRPGDVVVVIEGRRASEGTVEDRTDAIPVRHAESADAWFVEPWAFDPDVDGRIELVSPDPAPNPAVLAPGEPVEVTAPAAGRLWFSLNGAPPVERTAGVGTTVRWQPTEVPPTPSLLVVVFQTEKTFTALARRVVALDASSAEGAAVAFFDVWRAGSRERMLRYGSSAAVDQLAAAGLDAVGWSAVGCEGAAGSIYCTWARGAEHLVLRVSDLDAPRQVVEVRQEPTG